MSDSVRPWDVFQAQCPTREVLDCLADKWSLLILDRLRDGPVRFSELKRDIQSITQKVLTQVLRKLERDGLVARRVHATTPVAVDYGLTALGTTLTKPVAELTHWAERHMPAVNASRERYDAAARPAATPGVVRHRLR